MDFEWFYGVFLDLTTFSPLVIGWFCAQIMFSQTELFNSLCKLIFPVNTILLLESSPGRTSPPAPIYCVPRYYVFSECSSLLLLFVLSSLQEVSEG